MRTKITVLFILVGIILLFMSTTTISEYYPDNLNNQTRNNLTENRTIDEWWKELPDFKQESFVEKAFHFIMSIGYRIWPSKPLAGWLFFFGIIYFLMRLLDPTLDFLEDFLKGGK